MIPQCYPSVVNPVTKASEMQVFILSSVSGLVRWTDYIPIKFTDANPKKENTTDVGGYIPIKALSSTTGYKQWVDYVPVYVDSSATDAWQCSNVGFIPYSYGATLDLNFITSTVPSTVTFTRGSSATYFGSDGLLKVQGYNLLTYSQDFGNAIWIKAGSTIGTGYTDPLLGNTASKLIATAGSGAKQVSYTSGSSSSGLSAKVNSIYLKVGEYNLAHITVSDNVSGDFQGVVNLTTGAVTNTSSSGTWTSTSVTTQNVGNGWWRVSAIGTNTTNALAFLRVNIQTTAGNDTMTGDNTSGIYLWGAQLEAGSTATQYSPTTTAANSAPRLDYDPSTTPPTPRGLLVEEQRTNLLLNSDVAGTNLATQSITVTAAPWTVSFTGTGTITFSGAYTGSLVGTGAATRVTSTFTPSAGSLTCTVTGTVKWAQAELGSFATSFIPTAGASATRSADSASMTGTNFSSWYSQTQGTFVVEHDYIANSVQDAQVVVATNSTVTNMLGSRKPNNTTQTILQRIGAANTDITLAAATANTTTKMAHSYDGTGTSGVVNGGTVGTATAWTATDLDRLFIGQRNNASFLNGHIRRLQFYPVALPSATLQTLTA